jgi:hypothetical protein
VPDQQLQRPPVGRRSPGLDELARERVVQALRFEEEQVLKEIVGVERRQVDRDGMAVRRAAKAWKARVAIIAGSMARAGAACHERRPVLRSRRTWRDPIAVRAPGGGPTRRREGCARRISNHNPSLRPHIVGSIGAAITASEDPWHWKF